MQKTDLPLPPYYVDIEPFVFTFKNAKNNIITLKEQLQKNYPDLFDNLFIHHGDSETCFENLRKVMTKLGNSSEDIIYMPVLQIADQDIPKEHKYAHVTPFMFIKSKDRVGLFLLSSDLNADFEYSNCEAFDERNVSKEFLFAPYCSGVCAQNDNYSCVTIGINVLVRSMKEKNAVLSYLKDQLDNAIPSENQIDFTIPDVLLPAYQNLRFIGVASKKIISTEVSKEDEKVGITKLNNKVYFYENSDKVINPRYVDLAQKYRDMLRNKNPLTAAQKIISKKKARLRKNKILEARNDIIEDVDAIKLTNVIKRTMYKNKKPQKDLVFTHMKNQGLEK